jgi:hypothetical protein
MAYQLERLKTADGCGIVSQGQLRGAIERLLGIDAQRLARLWGYYRNPMRVWRLDRQGGASERPYRQAQEWGMPARITGVVCRGEIFTGERTAEISRKEVVIENDIGWRVETMVDYLFGKSLVIRSAAPDEKRREVIDRVIRAILAGNGGILFLQQLALLGAVYGFVDVLVKLDVDGQAGGSSVCGAQELGQKPVGAQGARPKGGRPGPAGSAEESGAGSAPAAGGEPSPAEGTTGGASLSASDEATDTGARNTSLDALIEHIARMVRLEIVEPARALPILSPEDYRVVQAYVQVYRMKGEPKQPAASGANRQRWWERLLRLSGEWWQGEGATQWRGSGGEDSVLVTEIITADCWQRYENETLVAEGANSLGEIPLVHIQNTAVPFEYSGGSEVEALIPLQDELNTRLSDRANRITLQSFKMYLGKGIENFNEMPVAPGRMWTTENDQADVVEFGGDSSSPSETAHITDLREAIDKTSGVTPIAAGAIKERIGRLTSAAALRITLISLLAKTDKKRTTYGLGLQRIIELALAWLDRAGVFATTPEERRVELHWPSPLPENQLETLQEAEIKTRLGVAKEVVLRELGY